MPAQTPPQERGGSHRIRDRAGFRRLPPQRPARALRAPARTPQSPKSHWEVWAGEARNEEKRL